eukprot:Gb_23926 [translate_table: standard]
MPGYCAPDVDTQYLHWACGVSCHADGLAILGYDTRAGVSCPVAGLRLGLCGGSGEETPSGSGIMPSCEPEIRPMRGGGWWGGGGEKKSPRRSDRFARRCDVLVKATVASPVDATARFWVQPLRIHFVPGVSGAGPRDDVFKDFTNKNVKSL